MAILGVDDFKSKLRGGGARPNLFKATINFPAYAGGNAEISSFLTRASSLPGSTIPEMIVPFRGRQLKIAGDRTFEPWATTIMNDTDFILRNAIERWMNGMNAHATNTGLVNPVDYQADLKVDQLDKDGSILKTYKFEFLRQSSLIQKTDRQTNTDQNTSAFVAVADLSETTFFGYPNGYKTYGVTLNYSF